MSANAPGDNVMLRLLQNSYQRPTRVFHALLVAALISMLTSATSGQDQAAQEGANRLPSKATKLAHPQITLKDEGGQNVLTTGKPISTRQSCGGDCHDYDFIADSFHFQQG